jgi:hypothetical protein
MFPMKLGFVRDSMSIGKIIFHFQFAIYHFPSVPGGRRFSKNSRSHRRLMKNGKWEMANEKCF